MEGIDCIKLLTDGQQAGLECLYKLYAKDLYRYGLAICGRKEEVNECLHDFFVFLWESRSKFLDVKTPKAYLMISFKRMLVRQLSKKKHHDELDYKYENEFSESSAEEEIIIRETELTNKDKLGNAIKGLSDREREVIHLKYFENYKNEEIAELLEINNQSVRNLLYRAIQNLRKKL